MPNTGPVPELCFLAGMGGGPISEERWGVGPERVVQRHLIQGGGGLVLCRVEAREGQGDSNGFKTPFQICPAGGVVPFLGTDVPRTSIHIPLAKSTPVPYSPTTL